MVKPQLPQFPEPIWRDQISLPSFPALNDSIKADVGIVGGGITGITAAYLLAKQNLNVVLLDAGPVLNGTTGHTTAKITAQHGIIYDEFITHFGLEKASLYYKAAEEAKEFIEHTVSENNIACDYSKEDAYIYTNDDSYISKLEKEKEAYERLNIESKLTDTIPLDLPVKKALIMHNQAQFHPLEYLKMLLEDGLKHGLTVYENTTASDIEYNKHTSIITRDGHRVTCKYVIVASHFPFYDRQSFYFARMYPERSYLIAGKSPEKFPGGMYINAESPTRSVRSAKFQGDDVLLIGGENHKTGQGKSTMSHYEALQIFAQDHFKIDKIDYRWSAQDLTTLDKVPYIGRITKEDKTVLTATGFRKWGMTNGTIAAKILVDNILDQDNPYNDLFTPARFQADPAVRKFMEINADVAKHLIKGKLEFTKNPVDELARDDAAVTRVNGKRVGVYKDEQDAIHMVDTTCTHLGCEVTWNSGDRTWDCPCHGSRFNYSGEVVEGPAKKPLAKIEEHK
ncbi:FAD-dependent oxidoreductase [Oceanobacillus damuensis]|uniref:FAD-dependent oxidoreductase n=1 Tax=Oceanobacillus damuensis TaxID=937928 RepID=UPI00082E63E5|nr:FAD-dependent oxidoreductase [Oceanobacillus damuensis]